jgi:NAD(P)-dependent dehydrogenase (short-subunit alcohol dehydrogenase family)
MLMVTRRNPARQVAKRQLISIHREETMNAQLENQIGIVTGSSSGNGGTIALAFSSAGATVVCADLNKKARKEGYEEDIESIRMTLSSVRRGMPLFRQTHPIPKPRRYWSDDKIHALCEALIASEGRSDP